MENAVIAWEWQDVDSGEWRSYDPESVRQIEDAYNGQRAQVPLSHGFFATSGGYTVDLTRMTQTRDSTGFQRPIRRIPPVPPLPGRTARAVPSRKPHRTQEPKLDVIKCHPSVRKDITYALGLFQRRDSDAIDAPVEEIAL